MAIWLAGRIAQSLMVLAAITIILFLGIHAIGNPVDVLISPEATIEEREQVIRLLGLDQPIWEQYRLFVVGIMHGDFGRSFVYDRPAIEIILERMPATMELAVPGLLIMILIGVPLGLYAGLNPNLLPSRLIMGSSILAFSIPSFWLAIAMIMVFSVTLGILPSTGRGETTEILGMGWSFTTIDGLSHMVLPTINLALVNTAVIVRLTRSGVQEQIKHDYIKFAIAKGLKRRRIIYVHLLKNIFPPIVTVIGLEFGSIIAFAVVTETVFSWPGMGKLLIDSISVLDRPVIVSYLMIVLLAFVLINLLVDIIYTILDPRVRLRSAR